MTPSLQSNDNPFPLRAPFSGTVVQIEKSEGEFIKEGDIKDFILRIDDTSKMFILANSPEIDRVKVKLNQEAVIKASAIINKQYIDGIAIESSNKVIVEFGDYFVLATIGNNSEIIIEQDMFFRESQDSEIKYLIEINQSDIIKSTAIDKLLNTIKDYSQSRLESFSYVFLFSWPPEAHYIFMRDYLTNAKSKIPLQLIGMYKKLHILHGEPWTSGGKSNAGESWYDEKYARFVLVGPSEFKQIDKPQTIKKDSKPLVGIIANGAFKIRDSRKDSETDGRNTGRGIACTNINKGSTMNEYLKILGIEISTDSKTKSICNEILKNMIKKEIAARASKDETRYVYLFND